ncbi:MAG: hypothetical protein QOE90_2305 [Thermoplasmata archaeon]|nr:hypothetical protein [Thermoplasmata archaeon]
MRLALLVLALLSAGCASLAPGGAPPSQHAAIAGWTLDCGLGAFERANNSSWPQDCVARATHAPGHKQEIWLAINPTDPDNVVIGAKDLNPASSKDCVWNGLGVTHDGGRTWKDVTVGGTYDSRQPGSPWFGYACNTDPMFAFTKDGALHYVVEMYNLGGQNGYGPLPPAPTNGRGVFQPGWDLVLATSTDGGSTFPDGQVIDLIRGDGIGVLNDYSRMVVSPTSGAILVAINTYNAFGDQILPQTIVDTCSVIASRDGGKSADPPVEITSTQGPPGVGCQAIAAAPDGTIVVLADQGDKVWRSESKDDGKTFSDPAPVFTKAPIVGQFSESKYRTGTNFECRFDVGANSTRKGALYCLYADASRDEADEWMRASTDMGKSWSDPVRVNDDNAGTHQFIGDFAIAGDGSLHAFFFDKRYDPAHKLIDITHALSTDGGKTWTNERVTTRSWDGDLGKHQEGFPFIGDYIGADCVGLHCWAGFPDATPGITVIAAAHVERR